MSTVVAIALGGNQGDVSATFEIAIAKIGQIPSIQMIRQSRNYRTRSIGADAGTDYINAAILVETELTAEGLLDRLQSIEQEHGRVRTVHWGPRPLDLDIIRFGDEIIETQRLMIPHPACWYRRFVLDPWCEIDDGWEHPVHRETVSQLRDRFRKRPLTFGFRNAISNSDRITIEDVAAEFAGQFQEVESIDADLWITTDSHGKPQPRTFACPSNRKLSELVRFLFQSAIDEPVPIRS
ncbi:MAG: 2-amino-4-hydroxy-6-hydroxymethyldihydropteridine diphosphokinase [Planctomycetaceae bacterium]|nr:2-amino-4-hydroxy-6-hydroxymethyldihydropteridine diphosphokinase [Planctomycetaceae bacterium]